MNLRSISPCSPGSSPTRAAPSRWSDWTPEFSLTWHHAQRGFKKLTLHHAGSPHICVALSVLLTNIDPSWRVRENVFKGGVYSLHRSRFGCDTPTVHAQRRAWSANRKLVFAAGALALSRTVCRSVDRPILHVPVQAKQRSRRAQRAEAVLPVSRPGRSRVPPQTMAHPQDLSDCRTVGVRTPRARALSGLPLPKVSPLLTHPGGELAAHARCELPS